MKKTKHITINLTENEYKQFELLAHKNRRKLSEYIALILLDATENLRADALRCHEGYIKKVKTSDIIK